MASGSPTLKRARVLVLNVPHLERAFHALGVAQLLRVLFGQPAREDAPLSEVVGVSPLPKLYFVH
jgi:hypothetical protein